MFKVCVLKFLYNLSDDSAKLYLCDRLSFQNGALERQGFAAQGGHVVDGSFVEVQKQRSTREENEPLKKGEEPESFEARPHVRGQKDVDARWTKRRQDEAADGGAEGESPGEVQDTMPGGAHFRSDEIAGEG
jgi:hypothetical protein